MEICQICFWVDDPAALRYATTVVGSNRVTLADAQRTYLRLGASEERYRHNVRQPRKDERKEEKWRPIDPELDAIDGTYFNDGPTEWPKDLEDLYYWRDNYWMRER
jgi:hypothetical protein